MQYIFYCKKTNNKISLILGSVDIQPRAICKNYLQNVHISNSLSNWDELQYFKMGITHLSFIIGYAIWLGLVESFPGDDAM